MAISEKIYPDLGLCRHQDTQSRRTGREQGMQDFSDVHEIHHQLKLQGFRLREGGDHPREHRIPAQAREAGRIQIRD